MMVRGSCLAIALWLTPPVVRAQDSLPPIRILEALQLKAHALRGTAVSFNAGFDLAAVASPASFSAFQSSIDALRAMTSEKQRPMLDLVVQLVTSTTSGVPVVSAL